MKPKYSIIIPVYNRPDEVDELLESLSKQTFNDFEVLVIEDGSTLDCEKIVAKYTQNLDVFYFYKENSGQGFSRNYGFERATGEWLIVFDSDCIIPHDYFEVIESYLQKHDVDAFGGPDSAHDSFTPTQKAISYSMTSLFTTGGIRGNKNRLGPYHPRSFNMGIHRKVFESTGGYVLPKKGEDIEFSIRIIESGFKTCLIEEAKVYHKRRTNFKQFYSQLHFFGAARINIFRLFKSELKLVHLFPLMFLFGFTGSFVLMLIHPILGKIALSIYAIYFLIIFVDAAIKTKSFKIGLLSIIASFIQLAAYGLGMMNEVIHKK